MTLEHGSPHQWYLPRGIARWHWYGPLNTTTYLAERFEIRIQLPPVSFWEDLHVWWKFSRAKFKKSKFWAWSKIDSRSFMRPSLFTLSWATPVTWLHITCWVVLHQFACADPILRLYFTNAHCNTLKPAFTKKLCESLWCSTIENAHTWQSSMQFKPSVSKSSHHTASDIQLQRTETVTTSSNINPQLSNLATRQPWHPIQPATRPGHSHQNGCWTRHGPRIFFCQWTWHHGTRPKYIFDFYNMSNGIEG